MKARLGAYGGWQLRDFVFERAAAIVVIFAVYIWAIYEQTAVREIVPAAGGSPAAARRRPCLSPPIRQRPPRRVSACLRC